MSGVKILEWYSRPINLNHNYCYYQCQQQLFKASPPRKADTNACTSAIFQSALKVPQIHMKSYKNAASFCFSGKCGCVTDYNDCTICF